jgi:PleD family two-component response regulator
MQNLSFAAPTALPVPMPVSTYSRSRCHLANRLATGEWGRPHTVPDIASDPAAAAARAVHRILWIDDEVESGDALLRLCALEGLRIDVAGSGGEGLATAKARSYDAIIIDLHLPDMFGLTVIQRLRRAALPRRFSRSRGTT